MCLKCEKEVIDSFLEVHLARNELPNLDGVDLNLEFGEIENSAAETVKDLQNHISDNWFVIRRKLVSKCSDNKPMWDQWNVWALCVL